MFSQAWFSTWYLSPPSFVARQDAYPDRQCSTQHAWRNKTLPHPPKLFKCHWLISLQPEHLPDKVGGPTTTGTVGCTFKYQYPTGPQYRISFSKKLVYFTVPALSDGTTVLALPYQQREVRPNLFLVHWIGPGRQGHVALVFWHRAEKDGLCGIDASRAIRAFRSCGV